MKSSFGIWACAWLLELVAAPVAWADTLPAVQTLRLGGCGGILPAAPALKHDSRLDISAEHWAVGRPLSEATAGSGYAAQSVVGLHVTGPEASVMELLRRSDCHTLMNKDLHDIGISQRGLNTWLVLATARAAPMSSQPVALASRALQLVNGARASGARCGDKMFAPAPAVRFSSTLAKVASGHATDMAEHNYFEHEDLKGQSPAARVRAVGYAEKLVGENIAYGVASVDEAVQGWLDSPGHCENIMDPRFAEMGIGYATGSASRRGLYWVQVLAEPRA